MHTCDRYPTSRLGRVRSSHESDRTHEIRDARTASICPATSQPIIRIFGARRPPNARMKSGLPRRSPQSQSFTADVWTLIKTSSSLCKAGDDVYGDLSESGFGGFAEYVCAREESVALKPRNLTYEQAAAIPHAAMLAQQSLRGIGHIAEGQTLLINGAGGGVGTFGVQLAKLHGVEVTGVDSAEKQDFLRSVGFDHVIDYSKEDFTATGQSYDVILDVKTNRSPFAYARALKPNGTYVTVGGSMLRLVQCLVFGRWIARTRNRHIRILALKPNKGLDGMTVLLEAGNVVPSIGDIYPLSEVPRAIRLFGEAHHKGKIVITIRGAP